MMECIHKNRRSGAAFFLRGALLIFIFLTATVAAESIKYYSRIYKVSPEGATFSLSNPSGSIKVKAWDRPEIKVNASLMESWLEVTERKTDNNISLEVHSQKTAQAHFDVSVPQNCTLDLKCLNGPIQISSTQGYIVVQTMEGAISLNDLHSPNITAKSISGSIIYNGILDPKGIYNFHSVENSVEITVPESSTFNLMATAVTGAIELGGFQLTDVTSKEKRVAGRCGMGGASLNLSTHRGTIRLHKK
jgi:hypothetical protein